MFWGQRVSYLALLLSSLLLLGSCTSAIAQAPLMPGTKTVLPIFQAVVSQLQGQTQVPIVLPTTVPTDALVPDAEGNPRPYLNVPITADGHFQQVVPHLTTATSTRYEIALGATADCQGADSCTFGLLSGEQIFQDTPTVASLYAYELEPDFQPVARSPEVMGEVSLVSGITGYFVPYVCGTNCDTSKIFWEQNGVRYSIGIRYGSQATLISLANSAIHNERTMP